MVAVIAGDVSPILAGDIYCSVLESCQETFDLRRADEWTTSLASWCATQPDLVRYRGECLLYRAELRQLRGKWTEAGQDAQTACELLMPRPAAGAAFYRVGEIERLRGQFDSAEAAYTRANERGRRPQPGLALLRLAQGDVDAAAAAIRGVLVDTRAAADRVRVLAAAVEILLAAQDREQASAAAAELSRIAQGHDASFLLAVSAQATGAVHLADGDVAGASTALRQACDIWRQLEMPYEEARTCLLIASLCERCGDHDGQRLELENARRLFTQLTGDARVTRLGDTRRTSQRTGHLTDREVQVVRLVAAGKSNRAIATELFISEKTVARHVSNIFDKLGVSSRAAATAWVYEHDLI
jgi:ATP/maltotriose-dependent transcriptional regulator MalT